jgi:hypothetical protein
MSRQKFKDVRFQLSSLKRIDECNEIIEEYQAQGLRLTLRQLYYQLVTKNIITNVEKSYKALSGLVSDARLAGKMNWDAIEDRVRVPKTCSEWDNLSDLCESALAAYRRPRWADQRYYVELWVEKDALAGVLQPIAREYHVTMMVNRGYSSQSAMYESAKRFLHPERRLLETPKENILLYLGDFDPSGEDMVRDIQDRLTMFHASVEVEKIALTTKQINKYKPPPNPAKVSDPRAAKYIEEHGDESWEVDALPPDVLTKLIRKNLDRFVDQGLMAAIKAEEDRDKRTLRDLVQDL